MDPIIPKSEIKAYLKAHKEEAKAIKKALEIFQSKPKEETSENLSSSLSWKLINDEQFMRVFVSVFSEQFDERKQKLKMLRELISANKIEIQHIPQFLKDLNIDDQETLVEMAKFIATKGNAWKQKELSRCIQKFEIEDENGRFNIAKILAAREEEIVSEFIQNFNLSEDLRYEIAKMALKSELNHVSDNIEDFNITDESKRIELATIASENDCLWNIQNYQIGDIQTRFDLAMENFRGNIQQWDLDQNMRYKVALREVEKGGSYWMKDINDFDLNETMKLDLAKKITRNEPSEISKCIKKFNFKKIENRFEIAKIVAEKDSMGWNRNDAIKNSISKYIYDYDLNEEMRNAIAEIAIENNAKHFAKHFKKYNFQDENRRYKLAIMALEYDFSIFYQYFKNFGISFEEHAFEILKIGAAQQGEKISKSIHRLPIKDQGELIDIAKIAAEDEEGGISIYIKNYGIENESDRIEIAKIAAANCGWEVAKYIDNYEISDENIKLEIIKLAASNDGGVSHYIKKLQITNKKDRIEIAKLAATDGSGVISKEIENFDIQEEKDRFEVYKIAARYNFLETAKNFDKYHLTSDEILFEVNKFTAKIQPHFMCEIISSESIEDPIHRTILFTIVAERFDKVEEYLDNFDFPFKGVDLDSKKLISHFQEYIELTKKQKEALVEVFDEINTLTDPGLKKQQILWLASSLHLLNLSSPDLAAKLLENKVLLKLVQLRDPPLRYVIMRDIFHFSQDDPKWLDKYIECNTEKSHLAGLYLAAQIKDDETSQVAKNLLQQMEIGKISSLLENTSNAIPFLHMLSDLENKEIELSEEQKLNIIQILLKQPRSLLPLINAVRTIPALGHSDYLKDVESNEDIDSKFNEAFNEEIKIEEIEDFAKSFSDTFGQFRNPTAIMVYLGSLKKLAPSDQTICLKLYADFLTGVIKGSFKSDRYEKSSHLQHIFELMPDIEDKWKNNISFQFDKPLEKKAKKLEIDFNELIKTTLQEDVPKGEYSFLREYFKTRDQNLIRKKLIQKLIKYKKDKTKQAPFKVQQLALLLMNCSMPENEKKALKYLSDMIKYIPDDTEFRRKLKAWHTLISEQGSKTSKRAGWTVVETDHPCDLLLSGTDILGSCQKINAAPRLNKCLLAYLMDGKNKIATVKDENGVIKARAMLRLLIDDATGKPVLFMERVYPKIVDAALTNALIEVAKRKSIALGIPLVSKEVGEGDDYPVKISSRSSVAPFEYVDGIGGIAKKGIFTIENAHQIKTS